MARIRTVKPEMWESQKLGQLPILDRLTFVGLISIADDEGRGRGTARYLIGRLHPYAPDVTESALEKSMNRLHETGMVRFYSSEGCDYYSLPNWGEHQKIDRPNKSVIPAFNPLDESSTSPRRVLDERSSEEGNGREGKGRDPSAETAQPRAGFRAAMDWYIRESEKITRERFKDDPAYKAAVDACYRRYGRAMRDIMAFTGGDSEKAIAGIRAIGLWLQGRGMSWNLDTAAKWMNDYINDPVGFGKNGKN